MRVYQSLCHCESILATVSDTGDEGEIESPGHIAHDQHLLKNFINNAKVR